MTHRVNLELSDELYGRIESVAAREYRTVKNQILWVLDSRFSIPHDTTQAQEALRDVLLDLHRRAGHPSSRSLAIKIGGISHTTVNDILRLKRVPPWPTLEIIINALSGSPSEVYELWAATQR